MIAVKNTTTYSVYGTSFLSIHFSHFRRFLVALYFSGVAVSGLTQTVSCDTLQADTAIHRLYTSYMSTVGGASALFNGPEYTGSYPLTTGTAFWKTNDFQKGTICYEGALYTGIPMAYDLVSNEVVIKGYQQLSIKLQPNRIGYFLLSGHLFVNTKPDTAASNNLPADFYDLLYNGAIRLYVKRRKQVERSFHAEDPFVFTEYNLYFVYMGNRFYPVTSRRDLLHLFSDKNSEVKKFWKEKKLNFKKDTENAIVQTVMYYDRIKQ